MIGRFSLLSFSIMAAYFFYFIVSLVFGFILVRANKKEPNFIKKRYSIYLFSTALVFIIVVVERFFDPRAVPDPSILSLIYYPILFIGAAYFSYVPSRLLWHNLNPKIPATAVLFLGVLNQIGITIAYLQHSIDIQKLSTGIFAGLMLLYPFLATGWAFLYNGFKDRHEEAGRRLIVLGLAWLVSSFAGIVLTIAQDVVLVIVSMFMLTVGYVFVLLNLVLFHPHEINKPGSRNSTQS